jgi:hypothetical protein
MNNLEDVQTVPKQTYGDSDDLPAMALICTALIARIEWCRRLVRQVATETEAGGWCAEEEGLRDALLDRDRTFNYRFSPPAVLERYTIGLEDGRTLIRAAWVECVWCTR